MKVDIKTILFDFDGVVIDSEPVHAKAKKIVLRRAGAYINIYTRKVVELAFYKLKAYRLQEKDPNTQASGE